MRLEEAKKYLNQSGYILEDTEPLDNEIEDVRNELHKKFNKKLSKKYGNLMDKVRNKSVENKAINAINFNMRTFFKGLEDKLSIYDFRKLTVGYDTDKNCQTVEYNFDYEDDPDEEIFFYYTVEFLVKYYDEAGYIELDINDKNHSYNKQTKIEIGKIDDTIEEVFDWFISNTKKYDFYE